MEIDRKGIAGFFIDIPALIVIIIGLSIFTASIYQAHLSYAEEKGEEHMIDDLDNFIKNFRNYDYISESEGVYRIENLRTLNSTILEKEYSPAKLEFHYKIEIIDDSNYNSKYYFSFQSDGLPKNQDIYSLKSPIILKEDTGISHLSTLRISIWGN